MLELYFKTGYMPLWGSQHPHSCALGHSFGTVSLNIHTNQRNQSHGYLKLVNVYKTRSFNLEAAKLTVYSSKDGLWKHNKIYEMYGALRGQKGNEMYVQCIDISHKSRDCFIRFHYIPHFGPVQSTIGE